MSTSIISKILHTFRAYGLTTEPCNKVPSCRGRCIVKICPSSLGEGIFIVAIRHFYSKHDKSANQEE